MGQTSNKYPKYTGSYNCINTGFTLFLWCTDNQIFLPTVHRCARESFAKNVVNQDVQNAKTDLYHAAAILSQEI